MRHRLGRTTEPLRTLGAAHQQRVEREHAAHAQAGVQGVGRAEVGAPEAQVGEGIQGGQVLGLEGERLAIGLGGVDLAAQVFLKEPADVVQEAHALRALRGKVQPGPQELEERGPGPPPLVDAPQVAERERIGGCDLREGAQVALGGRVVGSLEGERRQAPQHGRARFGVLGFELLGGELQLEDRSQLVALRRGVEQARESGGNGTGLLDTELERAPVGGLGAVGPARTFGELGDPHAQGGAIDAGARARDEGVEALEGRVDPTRRQGRVDEEREQAIVGRAGVGTRRGQKVFGGPGGIAETLHAQARPHLVQPAESLRVLGALEQEPGGANGVLPRLGLDRERQRRLRHVAIAPGL